jgi:trehalose-6-phosphatase
MTGNPAILSVEENFGVVSICEHGCVHVVLGRSVFRLTEGQYMRLVAMVSEGAANLELLRETQGEYDVRDEEG